MPISTVWILKYVRQCYVKWFWNISSLGAPEPNKSYPRSRRRFCSRVISPMIYIKITPLIIRNSKVHKEKTRNTNLPKRWMKLFPIQWMFAGIFAVKAARIAREVSRGIRRKQTHCACHRLPLNIFVSANPTWRPKMAPWQQNFNPPLLKNHCKSEPQIWEFILLTFNLLYDKKWR